MVPQHVQIKMVHRPPSLRAAALVLIILIIVSVLSFLFLRQVRERELFSAIARDDTMAVHSLLEAGVNPNAVYHQNRGFTLSLLKRMFKLGPMVDEEDSPDGDTALMFVFMGRPGNKHPKYNFQRDYAPENLAMVTDLIQHGSEVNCKEPRDGETPLGIASEAEYYATSVYLLDHGANINPKSKLGSMLFMWVPLPSEYDFNGSGIALAKRLLSHGDNINYRDRNGVSTLQKAAYGSTPEFIRFLLSNGAVPTTVDRWGNTPLSEATRSGDREVIRLIRDATDKIKRVQTLGGNRTR